MTGKCSFCDNGSTRVPFGPTSWPVTRKIRATIGSFVHRSVRCCPTCNDPEWLRNPIDRFVLARLEPLGLNPSPEANRATLLRRLFLDLTGLPSDDRRCR